MLATILPQENDSDTQHPYIPVHVETIDKFKAALVDSDACYNVINFKSLQHIRGCQPNFGKQCSSTWNHKTYKALHWKSFS